MPPILPSQILLMRSWSSPTLRMDVSMSLSLRASTAAAESAPGVLRVITPLNLPQLNVLPRDLTYDLPLERRPPLSDLAVHHVGQHVAVVVADTLENATYAASLFKLEYHVLEPVLDAWAVVGRSALPDENNGQVRYGSYLPDHFVKLTEEKLQDRRKRACRSHRK